MPLHDYIKRIYEEVNDPSYIIRFITYLVNTRYKRVIFSVNDNTVEPLITGVLEDIKTKKRFYSIAAFYTSATGIKVSESNINILSKVFVTKEYSVMRIICNIKEDEILNFFDQRYRTFLMYREIQKRIKFYTLKSINESIKLLWKETEFVIDRTKIICDKDASFPQIILKLFEEGNIGDLYYITSNNRHLISGT
jgi:hypothetical protein